MDDIQNFTALGARPRRHLRPPLRCEDYETDLPRLGARHHDNRETTSPLVGAAYSPYQPVPECPQDSLIKTELEEIRRERLMLQQSQQRMVAGLADLQALQADMLQIMNRAQSLQISPPPGVTKAHYEPDPIKEEEDWPPPPPPPPGFKYEPDLPYEPKLLPMFASPQLKAISVPVPPQPDAQFPPPPPPQYVPDRVPVDQPRHRQASTPEITYRGPRPSIPNLMRRDPGEFARLKIALENLLPSDSTELFKYQVLLDHLHLEEAKLIADAYLHSPTPFTDTMKALNDKLGQPHQLALRRIATVMDSPDIRRGDVAAFDKFALQIQSLVGMLKTLGPDGGVELQCGSHVARLLGKLPPEHRADFRRCMFHRSGKTYTLDNLATWLKYESWCQDFDGQLTSRGTKERPETRPSKRSITVLHGAEGTSSPRSPANTPTKAKQQPYCAFCDNRAHHLSQCPAITKLTSCQTG